jgi:hypothetical protein
VKVGAKEIITHIFTPRIYELTDKAIKAAKPDAKIKKLFDGNGSKYWSFKYRHLGKEKSLARS